MGIGTDTMKSLIAAVAGDPSARAEIADAVNLGNQALNAIDHGEVKALSVFAEAKPSEFEAVRAAEVAKKLEDVINPKAAAADIAGALAAEVAKR